MCKGMFVLLISCVFVMTTTYPKLLLNGEIEFAEVQYYFLVQISHATRPMAQVSFYSRPDPQLYKDSFWTVYSLT